MSTLSSSGAERDFSEETKQFLLGLVKEVEEEDWWNVSRWDGWYRIEQICGGLNATAYADNINEYNRKLIDINDASTDEINQIFDRVYEIDEIYKNKIQNEIASLQDMRLNIEKACAMLNI